MERSDAEGSPRTSRETTTPESLDELGTEIGRLKAEEAYLGRPLTPTISLESVVSVFETNERWPDDFYFLTCQQYGYNRQVADQLLVHHRRFSGHGLGLPVAVLEMLQRFHGHEEWFVEAYETACKSPLQDFDSSWCMSVQRGLWRDKDRLPVGWSPLSHWTLPASVGERPARGAVLKRAATTIDSILKKKRPNSRLAEGVFEKPADEWAVRLSQDDQERAPVRVCLMKFKEGGGMFYPPQFQYSVDYWLEKPFPAFWLAFHRSLYLFRGLETGGVQGSFDTDRMLPLPQTEAKNLLADLEAIEADPS